METSTDRTERNSLGMAGFVVSLVGLVCSLGVLSPVGLIISLFALGRKPRGFAIAGVVIGALGTCGLVIGIVLLPLIAVMLVAAGLTTGGLALASLGGPGLEAQVEMAILGLNVEEHQKRANRYPTTLAEGTTKIDPASELRIDAWKRPYVYACAPDGSAFRLYSLGPDGQPDTADDLESELVKQMLGQRGVAMPSTPQAPAPPATQSPSSESPAPEQSPEPPTSEKEQSKPKEEQEPAPVPPPAPTTPPTP